jgi:hypothetical protein
MATMTEKWKNQMLGGLKQAKSKKINGQDIDFSGLEAAVNQLNASELEGYNEEDKPVIATIQGIFPYVDTLKHFDGIPSNFMVGTNQIYSKATSLVSQIADDDTLLLIADELKSVCKQAVALVAEQNKDKQQFGLNFLEYYNSLS